MNTSSKTLFGTDLWQWLETNVFLQEDFGMVVWFGIFVALLCVISKRSNVISSVNSFFSRYSWLKEFQPSDKWIRRIYHALKLVLKACVVIFAIKLIVNPMSIMVHEGGVFPFWKHLVNCAYSAAVAFVVVSIGLFFISILRWIFHNK